MKQINQGRIIDQNINVKQSKLINLFIRYPIIEESEEIKEGRFIQENINVKQFKLTSLNTRHHTIEEKGAN